MKKYPISMMLMLFSICCMAQHYDINNANVFTNPSNEAILQDWVTSHSGEITKQIVTIPVVVHLVYKTTSENLTDARINEQIETLNNCYNDSAPYAPVPFDTVAADCEIRFCLAQRTPDGDSTNGIERVQTTVTSFSFDDQVKYTATGGADVWDANKYLNIWVCNLGSGLTAYAQFPGGSSSTDGVVVNYHYFGVTGASYPYNEGKTLVHELGHWLNLYHICCSEFYQGCPDTDGCPDTPPMNSDNFSCSPPPPPVEDSCTNTPIMNNYMQFRDDACLTFFTLDQKDRMFACLNTFRPGILTSDGCNPPVAGTDEYSENLNSIYIAPNPSSEKTWLHFIASSQTKIRLEIIDVTGRTCYLQECNAIAGNNEIAINTSSFDEGVYFIRIITGNTSSTNKIMVSGK